MPKDEDVTIVVNLSKDPPRTTVLEEFVSPLPKVKGAWYEIEAVPAEFILP
jgi:lipocalin